MDTPGTSLLSLHAFGWLAASLTWITFFCSDMRRLRLLGLAANAAFIVYASTAQLWPVLALHVALVPVNLWRLRQMVVGDRRGPKAPTELRRLSGMGHRERRRLRRAAPFWKGVRLLGVGSGRSIPYTPKTAPAAELPFLIQVAGSSASQSSVTQHPRLLHRLFPSD